MVRTNEFPLLRETVDANHPRLAHVDFNADGGVSQNPLSSIYMNFRGSVDFVGARQEITQEGRIFHSYGNSWIYDAISPGVLTVVVTLPPYIVNTDISLIDGDAILENLNFNGGLSIGLVNGNISISNTQAEIVSATTINGNISITESPVWVANLETINGAVRVTNSEFATLQASVVNGDVHVQNSYFEHLGINATTGNFYLDLQGSFADYNFYLTNSFFQPQVTLNGIQADIGPVSHSLNATKNINMGTTAGSIRITTQE